MKKKHFSKLLAAFLVFIFCFSVTTPAFATTGRTAETKAASTAITTEIQGTKKKTVIIGDSRTANLRQVRNNGVLVKDLLEQNGSILWDFRWGAKFVDMTTTLVPRLEQLGLDTIDNKTKIVLWMGYNDTAAVPTATVEMYIAYYNLMAMTWIARGATVYVMNVGPSGRMPGATKAQRQEFSTRNQTIQDFNVSLSLGLLPNIHYIDCYGFLKDTGYSTVDGTHYNAATSKKIYRFLMNATK